jgi:hypothetical protein
MNADSLSPLGRLARKSLAHVFAAQRFRRDFRPPRFAPRRRENAPDEARRSGRLLGWLPEVVVSGQARRRPCYERRRDDARFVASKLGQSAPQFRGKLRRRAAAAAKIAVAAALGLGARL